MRWWITGADGPGPLLKGTWVTADDLLYGGWSLRMERDVMGEFLIADAPAPVPYQFGTRMILRPFKVRSRPLVFV